MRDEILCITPWRHRPDAILCSLADAPLAGPTQSSAVGPGPLPWRNPLQPRGDIVSAQSSTLRRCACTPGHIDSIAFLYGRIDATVWTCRNPLLANGPIALAQPLRRVGGHRGTSPVVPRHEAWPAVSRTWLACDSGPRAKLRRALPGCLASRARLALPAHRLPRGSAAQRKVS